MSMGGSKFLFPIICLLFALAPNAQPAMAAKIVAKIDISQQRMEIYVNGLKRHVWRVSTGRRGYRTPTGRYRPGRMYRRYFSRKYYRSPMPHSVFFKGGYAIHGTNYVKRLGRRASHGCVRLHRRHAAELYRLINRYGKRNTRIVITR